jgi:hypothetical protein
MAAKQATLFKSHYEDDFLLRTLGDLIRRPDVALGELVANAWDAGASLVKVTIPSKSGEALTVEDDGAGLTKEQFDQRWMTLAYNRQKNQGSEVEFPPGRQGRRRAFGRNGQGRHGLLCFNTSYRVSTTRDGTASTFDVKVASGEQPFISTLVSEVKRPGYGTKLAVEVRQNLPDPDRIREVLSARFLHDPNFAVLVNGESLPFTELAGYAGEKKLTATDPTTGRAVKLTLSVIEAEVGRTKHQSGVAFWVGGRLVGEPGWTVMGAPIVDGRTRPGRRLTFVVQSDDLMDDVVPEWTEFKKNDLTKEVGRVVAEAIKETLRTHYAERVRETTADVLNDFTARLDVLERGERVEVAEVAEAIAYANPLVAPEVLSVAVSGMIDAKQKASALAFYKRIEGLALNDLDGLHRLLDEWTVKDALTVLDEVGRRIKVVEALQKLMGDPDVDELHILHPLVTQARWLFGPEYDSPHYAANVGLRNAVSKALKVDAAAADFHNARKRPDLLVRPDSTVSFVASENFDPETGLAAMRAILLVELKKGGFKIGRKEMDQAGGYIEDVLSSGHVTGVPYIHAFVVGHELDPKTTSARKIGDPERGRVDAATFAGLISTANARLFRLRGVVEDRYPESSKDVLERWKQKPLEAAQLGISFPAPKATSP